MLNRLVVSAAISLTLVVACLRAQPAAQTTSQTESSRKPAAVMSPDNASWLERAGRDQEDRPEFVIEVMNLKPGDIVADIGAGSGYFSRRLARAVAPGGKVYAVDVTEEMLKLVRESAVRDGITNIVPILGSDSDPKLPDGKISKMLLVDVYHEFQNPTAMLAALKRDLAPKGRVYLIENRLEGETARHVKREHRMSVKDITSEWGAAGFRILERHDDLPTQHFFVLEAIKP